MIVSKQNTLTTTLLPVQLCNWVTRNRFCRPFQIYLYLRDNCSGKLKLSNEDLQNIASLLDVSTRTVINNIQKLIQANWIGYNKKSQYYHIRSIEKIKHMYGFIARSCAEFDMRDLLRLKEFMFSAQVGAVINHTLRSRRRCSTERNSRVRSKQLAAPAKVSMSNRGIAECLGISKSKVHVLKRAAKAHRDYIEVTPYQYKSTGVPESNINEFRNAYRESLHLIRVARGFVVIAQPDLISHSIRLKCKRMPLKKVVGKNVDNK